MKQGPDVLNLFSLQTNSDGPIKINVTVDNKSFEMELDTGSQSCVVPLAVMQSQFKNIVLKPTTLLLRTYTGALMKPEGMVKLKVKYNGWCKALWFVVVKEKGPILLGRDFLKKFRFKLSELNYEEVVHTQSEQPDCLKEFPSLFDGGLGEFNKAEVHLTLKEGAQPKFCKPRPLPLALKEKVESQINKLVELGMLEPVEFSELGTPIVPILKKDGDVRICGDFKVTVNPCLKVEQYPLPRIEDLFSKLFEGKEFSKLDLSMAYQQCKLDTESKAITTISTTKGLFQYSRLMYGLACAPAIFHRLMETLLAGLEGVAVFLDDILITAPTRELHVKRLRKVLKILEDAGLKLAKNKCVFFSKQVEYLGHIIDEKGLRANQQKVLVIDEISYPKTVKEVQVFLGMVNFYRKFIPNIAGICAPLYELLKTNSHFHLSEEAKKYIKTLKEMLKADTCLAHFNLELVTKVTVDASPIGVAAVLSQIGQDGQEKPIEFA